MQATAATSIWFDDANLWLALADGRTLSVPLAYFPRLLHASDIERQGWRLIGDGRGIHWEAIDEDISVAGLLRGSGDLTRRG